MDDMYESGPFVRAPRSADELHAWVREHLDVQVPRQPLMVGHSAPFDYLCHAFFETDPGRARDCVVWANRGGGKTFLAAVATALDLIFKPGIEIRILGGSLEQAKRMHAHLRQVFSRPAFSALLDGKITERRIRLGNGSVVELLAQSQTSVRGTRVQKLRCDEVELFDPDVWEAAQLTTRSKDCGGVLVSGSIECLSTMHVPYGLMYRLVAEAREGVRNLFKWGVIDVLGVCDEAHQCCDESGEPACPLYSACLGRAKLRDAAGSPAGHIDVRDALRQQQRVSEATWSAEMLCLRPRRSDCVLPEFDRAVHVVDALPGEVEGAVWIGGMDFGIRAPTVVLWARVDPDGVLYVVDERAQSGVVLAEHAEAILKSPWPTLEWIAVDPAGNQRSGQTGISDVQALTKAGLRCRWRRMGVMEGLSLVRARLKPASGSPRLYVHQRCRGLVESLEKYRYPAENPHTLTPVKDGSDHAVDALRYMVQCLDRGYETKVSRY
ncbi:MAG: hypothetical protein D6695_05875 [Planctomycetota bacterium]|nr:MAG: hypothetical protein D6695_05875 [Planctomycetota bacterium]